MIAKGAQGAKRRVLDPCQVWGFFSDHENLFSHMLQSGAGSCQEFVHVLHRRRAARGKLTAIEGYDSIEELASAILSTPSPPPSA